MEGGAPSRLFTLTLASEFPNPNQVVCVVVESKEKWWSLLIRLQQFPIFCWDDFGGGRSGKNQLVQVQRFTSGGGGFG